MKIRILRQKSAESEPYWECFDYDGPEDNTIAGVIDYLNFNDDIINDAGEKTSRIGWECSCMQGMCGACAMIINDVPALACEAFLKDLKGDGITIRPLTKFPVIRDLVVDRSSIHENLKKTNVFIGEYEPPEDKDHEHQYTAAKCLKCGLCLEVCPNYEDGGSFYGATFANDCYLVAARNHDKSKEISKVYNEHYKKDCTVVLTCRDICPMGIPMTASMAKLNRIK